MADYYFLETAPDGELVQQHCIAWELDGPPAAPVPMADNALHALGAPVAWGARPFPNARLMYEDTALSWVETALPSELLAGAIEHIDAAGDAARVKAIGDPARALEYQQAEQQAREYRARRYVGDVPDDVESWAEPKGWSGQQAAEDIIATADRWRTALSAIRKLRLAAKEQAREIAANPDGTAEQMHAVQTDFITDLAALMADFQ